MTIKLLHCVVGLQMPGESEKKHVYLEYLFASYRINRLNASTNRCSCNQCHDQLQNDFSFLNQDRFRYPVHTGQPTMHPSHNDPPGYPLPVSSRVGVPGHCEHHNNCPSF